MRRSEGEKKWRKEERWKVEFRETEEENKGWNYRRIRGNEKRRKKLILCHSIFEPY